MHYFITSPLLYIIVPFFSFYRLLENGRFLLVLANRENFFVYLQPLAALDRAIRRNKFIKYLNRDRLGHSVLFSFDETKRILAVCASTTRKVHFSAVNRPVAVLISWPVQLQLHMLVFDETYKTCLAQGSGIDISPWYSQAESSILLMASVCGKEEVALVDSSARVRIFSFITLQFRFVSLPFHEIGRASLTGDW